MEKEQKMHCAFLATPGGSEPLDVDVAPSAEEDAINNEQRRFKDRVLAAKAAVEVEEKLHGGDVCPCDGNLPQHCHLHTHTRGERGKKYVETRGITPCTGC